VNDDGSSAQQKGIFFAELDDDYLGLDELLPPDAERLLEPHHKAAGRPAEEPSWPVVLTTTFRL
jgi:hypothetical protein